MEPMNATQTHSKVRVTTSLSAPVFVAGGEISGKMELDCRADKGLGINTMMVELIATQELISRDHSATSVFMSDKRLFQGPGLPPSNSVYAHPQPGAPPLPPQYHQARKGCTTFFFNFPLPVSSPNSVNFGNGLARIFYEIKATVAVFWKGERTLVRYNKEVLVTECLLESRVPREPSTLVAEGGKMVVQAQVVGGIGVGGRSTCVELQVKNHSQKKTTGLTLTLLRTLHLPNVGTSKNPFQLTDTVVTVPFRGSEYTIAPGVEGVANLVFDVPRNARGVKGGPRERTGDGDHKHVEALFHIDTTINIAIAMGLGNKDIKIELPLTILHPLAAPVPAPEPQFDPYSNPVPLHALEYIPPALDPPRPFYALPPSSSGPPSPASHSTPPLHYQHTPTPPHGGPYVPQASPIPFYGYAGAPVHYAPHIQPYALIPAADQMYYYPLAPQQTTDYLPRPTSATIVAPHSFADPSPLTMPALPPAPAAPASVGSPEPAVAVPGQTEEGKGERASRISLHLKQSSRNRSASPTSHRYRMTGLPLPLPPPSVVWDQPSTSRPRTPELLPPAPKLHSPRPMLSPKASFTGEALAGAGQSGRVAALEKMVEEAEQRKSQEIKVQNDAPENPRPPVVEASGVELDAKELNEVLEKTLPLPPPPSIKPKAHVPTSSPLLDMFNQRAQAADKLVLEEQSAAPKAVVVMNNLAPKRARHSLPEGSTREKTADDVQTNEESSPTTNAKPKPPPAGLDALERRLLKEVGTRKPSAAVIQQLQVLEDATTAAVKAKVEEKRKLGVEPHVKPVEGSVGATVTPSEDKEAAIHVLLNRKRRKTFDVETPTRPSGDAKGQSGLTPQEEEALRLRRAAKARVAGWLGSAQEADPPPLSETRIIEHSTENHVPEIPAEETTPATPVTAQTPSMPNEAIPEKEVKVDPSKIQLPGRTSSGFLPMTRPPAKVLPRVAELSSAQPVILERYKPGVAQQVKAANYDVRSARGGRGGKVTSVAAIWAEKANQDGTGSPPPPVSPKIPRDAVPLPVMARLGQEKIKLPPPSAAKPKPVKPQEEQVKKPSQDASPRMYPWFGAALSPARSAPANLAKGVSVPAKLSSSIASPTLSSTESLARPQPVKPMSPTRVPAVKNVLPTLDMVGNKVDRTELTPSASAPGLSAQVVSFGQARIKGLIAKYQGGG